MPWGSVVRRTRFTDRRQLRPWPNWRHFGFLTDLAGTTVEVDAFHRQHAVVELTIRDLKEGAGPEHIPSGDYDAKGAWLQCSVLDHNLTTGQPAPADELSVARTTWLRPIKVPARLVNRSGALTLRGLSALAVGAAVHPPPRRPPGPPRPRVVPNSRRAPRTQNIRR